MVLLVALVNHVAQVGAVEAGDVLVRVAELERRQAQLRETWGDDPNRYREMGLEFPKE